MRQFNYYGQVVEEDVDEEDVEKLEKEIKTLKAQLSQLNENNDKMKITKKKQTQTNNLLEQE